MIIFEQYFKNVNSFRNYFNKQSSKYEKISKKITNLHELIDLQSQKQIQNIQKLNLKLNLFEQQTNHINKSIQKQKNQYQNKIQLLESNLKKKLKQINSSINKQQSFQQIDGEITQIHNKKQKLMNLNKKLIKNINEQYEKQIDTAFQLLKNKKQKRIKLFKELNSQIQKQLQQNHKRLINYSNSEEQQEIISKLQNIQSYFMSQIVKIKNKRKQKRQNFLNLLQSVVEKCCKNDLNIMKKVTNNYRRCQNCPHSKPKPCCCNRSNNGIRNKQMTSRNKCQVSTIQRTSALNTTIPTIIAQFSALRTQNNNLKRQLLNVSTFMKDDQTVYTTNSQPSLNEKLFIANKNLKQALLQIDNLSKANKQLQDRNLNLSQQSEGLKIQLKQVQNYLERYRKKYKKASKNLQQQITKDKYQEIMQQNKKLNQQIYELKQQIRCIKFQNKNLTMINNLSPQWIAHTGNKLKNKKQQEEQTQMFVQLDHWKQSISQTISFLKNDQNNIFKHSFNKIKDHSANQLLQTLIEQYSQNILSHFNLLIKEINRKINNYDKKINNLAQRLQNFLINFKNKKMKRKITSLAASSLKTQRIALSQLTNRI